MTDPPKLCEWCGGPITAEWKGHRPTDKDARRFCKRKCSNSANAQAKRRVPVLPPWELIGGLGVSDDGDELTILVRSPDRREYLLRWSIAARAPLA